MAVFKFLLSLAVGVIIFLEAPGVGREAGGGSAKNLTPVAELALYRGPDRKGLLEEGARKEGTLTYYTTATLPTLVLPTIKAFNKKYPYIKVQYFRADTAALFTRVTEEHRVGNHTFDVLDTSAPYLYEGRKIVQPFYSPELINLEKGALRKETGASDNYWAGHWETCIILMYNTNKVPKAEAPKTYQDLLDPQWKGKMTLPTTTTGIYWVGNILTHQGEQFVNRMAKQDIRVQNISGGALGELVVSGEVPLTPATFTSNATRSLASGAPVGVSFVAAGPFKKWYYTLVPNPVETHKRWQGVLMEKFVERK